MNQNLYEERLLRIRKAVACQPVDRIPVAPCGNAYYARSQHVLMKDYITDFDRACTANLAELQRIDADATQNVIFSPYLLGTQWLSTTAVPGDGLDDDAMWQMTERENMRFEEYEDIKRMGWDAWQKKFIAKRCNDNWKKLEPFSRPTPGPISGFTRPAFPVSAIS